jgi:hypothetical protein
MTQPSAVSSPETTAGPKPLVTARAVALDNRGPVPVGGVCGGTPAQVGSGCSLGGCHVHDHPDCSRHDLSAEGSEVVEVAGFLADYCGATRSQLDH